MRIRQTDASGEQARLSRTRSVNRVAALLERRARRSRVAAVRRPPTCLADPMTPIERFAAGAPAGAPAPAATGHGVSRCRSRGNNVTCRMFSTPVRRATKRSSPNANPPCGGMPYWNDST